MLIPDNINPKDCIYFKSASVLKIITEFSSIQITDLYFEVCKIEKISFSVLLLCLDWLYLINLASIDDKGVVKCTSSH